MHTRPKNHRGQRRARRLFLPVWLSIGAVLACDGGSRAAEQQPGGTAERDTAALVLQASIGENESRSPENQFFAIAAMLVTDAGELWVVDGYNTQTPQVRIFAGDGHFVRRVGDVGSGPGEYRNPHALGLLPGGRVALRDRTLADRITIYTREGIDPAVRNPLAQVTFQPPTMPRAARGPERARECRQWTRSQPRAWQNCDSGCRESSDVRPAQPTRRHHGMVRSRKIPAIVHLADVSVPQNRRS